MAAAAVLYLRASACFIVPGGSIRLHTVWPSPPPGGVNPVCLFRTPHNHRELRAHNNVGEAVKIEGESSTAGDQNNTVTTHARCNTRYGAMAYRVVRPVAEQPVLVQAATAHEMGEKMRALLEKEYADPSFDSMMHVVFIHGLGDVMLIVYHLAE